jgi:phytoene dehydrogenase-like protein
VYDVLVLGAEVGGAFAAALLAKRGLRVLWAEHAQLAPGYEHGGFLFATPPYVVPPFRTWPMVESCFTELGLTTGFQRSLKPAGPWQIVLPRHRLDLPVEPPRRLAELQREFGGGGSRVAETLGALTAMPETSDPFFRFLNDFAPGSWLERIRLRRRAAKVEGLTRTSPLSPDEPLESLLTGAVQFLVQQEPAGPLAVTRVLAQLLKNPLRLSGGREGLRETLGKRFTELGGTLLPQDGLSGRVVEGIDFQGSQVTLRVRGAEAVYRAQWLVAAMEPPLLAGLLPEEGPGKKLAEHLGGLVPKRLVLTVHWVLPEKVLPRAMGDLVLLDGGQTGPVWIQVHSTRRAGTRGEEEALRTVSASALVGSGVREAGESGLRLPAAGLERALEALMPFSLSQRVARSVPLVDGPGALAGAGPQVIYETADGAATGLEGLGVRTPAKNVLFAGREAVLGVGLEGELLAAARAAGLVHEHVRKRDPLKR